MLFESNNYFEWICFMMAFQIEMLDKSYINFVIVTLIPYFATGQSALTTHVAKALPFSDISLSGSPVVIMWGVSRLRCIVECTRNNCTSFNFGTTTCELYSTYLCENTESLYARAGFRHYDVEFGVWIQDADTYRQTTECTTLGKCSPKCYTAGSTTTTTTTTLTPTTTTTITTTTTTAPPAPGEVNHECATENDCTTLNADCRNNVVCECKAGYSYNPPNKTCDEGCETYGSTFFLTTDSELQNHTLWYNETLPDRAACRQECERTQLCFAVLWNFIVEDCYVLGASGKAGDLVYNPFYEYWQRNCDG